MKLLIYGNRKQDDLIWDASTPEKEAAAFLLLFKILKDDWRVYEADELSKRDKAWYDKAKEGDAEAARKLLTARKSYEYETWHFGKLTDPLAVTQ